MLYMLAGSNWHSKIDLTSGYHLIHNGVGNKWKTTYITQEGVYERSIMS